MLLKTNVNRVEVEIDLPGISEEAYQETAGVLDKHLASPSTKNRDAISEGFLFALIKCPTANASDLWHHVVYRLTVRSYRDTAHKTRNRAGSERAAMPWK